MQTKRLFGGGQSDSAHNGNGTQHKQPEANRVDAQSDAKQEQAPKKTQLQQDEELMKKMQGLSGDGGEAGVEYEDGQPVSMKRSVKNNMFRYI
ncbi:hypothetical protein B0A50_05952 [Salinomyces thailandicus]|uniref:Uncharacterized protein n=1 Tax=Salinomyces thailandicus TaxID=706561 RepID=A0A4U0TSW4_9PEZI|nr:hypothetical protein B0A50_05952 [Salinomyces thailandica]